MSSAVALEILRDNSAYFEGHFKLASGLHSDRYIQCARALQHPGPASELGAMLADKAREAVNGKIDVVVGPAMGGIIVAHELGRALGVRAVFMERVKGEFTLRRGFEIGENENVLLCEDVVTTGGSVRKVQNILEKTGRNVLAIAAIADRSGGDARFTVPFVPLVNLEIAAWKPEECPLCQNNVELTVPGSGGLS